MNKEGYFHICLLNNIDRNGWFNVEDFVGDGYKKHKNLCSLPVYTYYGIDSQEELKESVEDRRCLYDNKRKTRMKETKCSEGEYDKFYSLYSNIFASFPDMFIPVPVGKEQVFYNIATLSTLVRLGEISIEVAQEVIQNFVFSYDSDLNVLTARNIIYNSTASAKMVISSNARITEVAAVALSHAFFDFTYGPFGCLEKLFKEFPEPTISFFRNSTSAIALFRSLYYDVLALGLTSIQELFQIIGLYIPNFSKLVSTLGEISIREFIDPEGFHVSPKILPKIVITTTGVVTFDLPKIDKDEDDLFSRRCPNALSGF